MGRTRRHTGSVGTGINSYRRDAALNVKVGDMGRMLARIRREEKGQNLVELALILPVVLLLLFGMLDFARAFNYKDQTTQVANETARWMIVDQVPGQPGPSITQYKAWACGEIVSSELKTSVGCPTGTNIKVCFTDAAGVAKTTGVTSGDSVTVTIPASLTPISYLSSVIPGFSALKLTGKATMRMELPPTNGFFGTGDTGC